MACIRSTEDSVRSLDKSVPRFFARFTTGLKIEVIRPA